MPLEAFQLFTFTLQSGYGWAAASCEEIGCSLLLEGSLGLTGAAPHGWGPHFRRYLDPGTCLSHVLPILSLCIIPGSRVPCPGVRQGRVEPSQLCCHVPCTKGFFPRDFWSHPRLGGWLTETLPSGSFPRACFTYSVGVEEQRHLKNPGQRGQKTPLAVGKWCFWLEMPSVFLIWHLLAALTPCC